MVDDQLHRVRDAWQRLKRSWGRYRAIRALQKIERCLPDEDVHSRLAVQALVRAMDRDITGADAGISADRQFALLQVMEICNIAEDAYRALDASDDPAERARRHGLLQQNGWLRDEVEAMLNPASRGTLQ